MKICICKNPSKKESLFAVEKFISLLKDNKIEYFFYGESQEVPDLIAVFGGDGTILQVAPYAVKHDLPILAINVGTVGFLSSFEEDDLETAINLMLGDNLKITKKTALEIKTDDGESFFALNDAVIERDQFKITSSVVAKLDFFIDKTQIYKLSADGIIISTPTGSTAYSLSAGGVILTPDLKSFIATPICSHSLYTRPIVYADNKKVRVTVRKNSCDCVLCVDGRGVKRLTAGDSVEIKKHKKSLKIVDCGEEFFNRLIKKLGK